MSRFRQRIARFARDRRGVSAVEFALIAPLLILLFVGSFEITRAVNMNRQVSLLARTVSDFISQQEAVTVSDIQAIFKASSAVMYPYPVDDNSLKIHVESIEVGTDRDATAKIKWSYEPRNATERASTYEGAPGQSVIKATVSYKPTFIFSFMIDRFDLSDFHLSETAYMAPRMGKPVALK